jgi:hypothetical protein
MAFTEYYAILLFLITISTDDGYQWHPDHSIWIWKGTSILILLYFFRDVTSYISAKDPRFNDDVYRLDSGKTFFNHRITSLPYSQLFLDTLLFRFRSS